MDSLVAAWKVEFHSGIPVYKQIVHLVQAAITSGRLQPGDQLPTIRALHHQLQVNPNTVARAYRELEHLGSVAAEHGSGCFVAPDPVAPKLSPREVRARASELSARVAAEARSRGIPLAEIIAHLSQQSSHA